MENFALSTDKQAFFLLQASFFQKFDLDHKLIFETPVCDGVQIFFEMLLTDNLN